MSALRLKARRALVCKSALGVLAVSLLILSGARCGASLNGDFAGVTTGGAQDMAYARQSIEDGDVPNPDSITVEGLLSEHSIEVPVPDDPGLLYATAAAAWNHDFDELTPLVTVQVGFGTTINAETFEREPQNLCIVVDVSRSMSNAIDDRTRTSKLEAVKIAIDRLMAQLDGRDRVSLVTFAFRATTRVENVSGTDVRAIKEALDGIEAENSTDLARGLARGYSVVADHSTATRADRIIVFTDADVTSGTTEAKNFLELMNRNAGNGIGATIFGVGVDFDDEFAYDISQVRGANLFFLNDYDRIVTVFDEEFDYLVTPVAYDVSLTADVPFTFDVADAYGLPEIDTNTHLLEMTIPTLFLSSREGGGAILIRLRPGAQVNFEEEVHAATVELTFAETDGAEARTTTFDVVLPAGLDADAAVPWFETPGVQRGVLLLNTALVLKNACFDGYGGWRYFSSLDDYVSPDRERGRRRLTEFLPWFDTLAEGLEDQPSPESRSLSQERAVVAKLLENIGGAVEEP